MVEIRQTKRRKATLDDLKPLTMVIEVDDVDADGEPVILEFKLRSLTYFQYNDLGTSVPDPAPATIGVDKNGRPLYDTSSNEYQSRRQQAANYRGLKRLAAALIEPEIPGGDYDEKAHWMQEHMPVAIVNQLIMMLGTSLQGGEARIKARADSFHANGSSNSPPTGTEGQGDAVVERPDR